MNISIRGNLDKSTGSIHAAIVSHQMSTITTPPPCKGAILEIEDTHFHHDSAVLLPGYDEKPSATGSPTTAKGLHFLVVTCIQSTQSDQSILVVGHTDRSGSTSYNQSLSELRSSNVYNALRGDRARWVTSTMKKYKTEDYQFILAWLTHEEGWDCDPGEIDNSDDEEAHAALKKFQEQYNLRYSASIEPDGVIGLETWGAIFDVYMSTVAETLGVTQEELRDIQNSMTFLSLPAIGCGERCPVTPDTQQNYRNPTDRRVEVLFFDPDEAPPVDARDICSILYLKGMYTFTPVPVDPSGKKVDTVTLVDELDEPAGKVAVEVTLSDGSVRHTATSVNGKIRVFGKTISKVTIEDIHAISDA